MSLALENFVDVKIKRKATGQNNLVYDTVIYVDPQADTEGHAPIGYYSANGSNGNGSKEKPWGPDKLQNDNFKKWANIFFANNGKYINHVQDFKYDSINKCYYWTVSGDRHEIPLNEIVVVGVPAGSDLDTLPIITEGINQKIFLVMDTIEQKLEGVVEVYSSASNTLVTAPMAAYYTQIDITNPSTIKDYCFTVVKDDTAGDLNLETEDSFNSNTGLVANINYIAYLAGAYRNIGGDDTAGIDITNTFMKIVLQQVLTNTLMNLLVSKIKLDSSGIIAVKNATAKVMTQFVNNGYISTEKAWPDEDLYIDNELVAEKDTPLIDGYKIHVSPITQDDIKNHQIPTVYIVYGDQVGVRKITISGEVF